MLFRPRDLIVGQRTQLVNLLRGRLAEHCIIFSNVGRLAGRHDEDDLPELVRQLGRLCLNQIAQIAAEIDRLHDGIAVEAKERDVARRLQKVPGIRPVRAMAVATFAPEMREFRRGRDFSAWLGLVPRQHSSGGKQKLGRASKIGQRDIRRLLIIAAMSVVHWRGREGGRPGLWLCRTLARKPRMVWAMLTRNEDYCDPNGAVR